MKADRIASLVRMIPSLMSTYGFPAKFLNETFSLPDVVAPFLDLKTGLCLTGKAGVGKSMAMALLVRDWLRQRAINSTGSVWGTATMRLWKFVSFPEFIMDVQDSFRSKDYLDSPYQKLESIAKVPYLVLDDLGAEKATEYVRQATYFIINHREMNLLPTFITTNFSMDHLDENIDPRISSRICGMCEIMRFEGKDRRIKERRVN